MLMKSLLRVTREENIMACQPGPRGPRVPLREASSGRSAPGQAGAVPVVASSPRPCPPSLGSDSPVLASPLRVLTRALLCS